MFWGFLLTATALAILAIFSLVEIYRVDRIIERVDRDLEKDSSSDKS